MKALVKSSAELGIWMQDVEKPTINHNQVLIKIKKTAICGTDIHIYQWDKWAQNTINVPLTIGHEFVGEVVAVGSHVADIKVGQRVTAEGHVVCGRCRACRSGQQHLCPRTSGTGVNHAGAFAEYLAMPQENIFKLPDDIADDVAAVMDPLGNAVHTAVSFDCIGQNVLITGAGPIGLMAAAVVKKIGARAIVITDVNDYRLSLAQQLKVTRVVNVSRESLSDVMNELGIVAGFEVAYEMSGNEQAFNQIVTSLATGGSLAILGLIPDATQISWHELIFKGLTIKGIYGREMYKTWYQMSGLLQNGLDITSVITHHFKVSDYQEAFDLMASGQSGKVILDWDE